MIVISVFGTMLRDMADFSLLLHSFRSLSGRHVMDVRWYNFVFCMWVRFPDDVWTRDKIGKEFTFALGLW